MHIFSLRTLFVAVSSVWFVLAFAGAEMQSQNSSGPVFPALMAFGDSLLDTSNNNLLLTVAKSNFPPYGKDFIDHQPTGRFCNGRLLSDFTGDRSLSLPPSSLPILTCLNTAWLKICLRLNEGSGYCCPLGDGTIWILVQSYKKNLCYGIVP